MIHHSQLSTFDSQLPGPLPIFVYGTLQQGEVRSNRWPHAPEKIEPATIRGQIRDLGPYPALIDGDGIVSGELWTIGAGKFDETIRVLDEIEGYGNEDADLYVRKVVDCVTADGERKRAYTYYFANPSAIRNSPLVPANSDGVSHWRRRAE
jgi:gamma-glutamylcyclotransferase (GGCT)/AIG2-like uncharacterized protein YtfP